MSDRPAAKPGTPEGSSCAAGCGATRQRLAGGHPL